MDSDDNAPQQPSRRPTWRVRAIVSGAAAAAVMAVAYGIVNAANRIDPLDKVAAAPPPTGAAAVARLRSQLPPDLRAAKECVQAATEAKALATITCVWEKSHVPRTATYSLFADNAAMDASAKSLRDRGGRGGRGRGGGLGVQGTSCDSADDFGNGGKTTWQSDNRERGTMWCYLNKNGEPELLYTDTATAIVSSAIAPEQQQAVQLLGWFRETGQPEPSPEPTPSGSSPSTSPSITRGPTTDPTVTPESPGEPGPTGPGTEPEPT